MTALRPRHPGERSTADQLDRALEVVQLQRRAPPGVFSIERLFEGVRAALPPDVRVRIHCNRHESRGLLPRLADAWRARRLAGRVTHVLGDVHYLVWFLPRRGTILTVHDCVSLERLRGARRWLLWLLWYWLPLRRAQHVTVVSEYTRRELQRWLPSARARMRVIPPPVPLGLARAPMPPRGEQLRLLQVGTAENKNLLRVIEACGGLPVRLVIVGRLDRSARARLAEHAVAHENHVDLDPAALFEQYRACHAVILASTYEGFGLPIIEAQQVGRPVITSRIAAMPEAAGGAACLVDPFDVQDIRRGIRRVLEDAEHCARLVELGLANAARHAPERIAAAYAELYRDAGAGSGEREAAQRAGLHERGRSTGGG